MSPEPWNMMEIIADGMVHNRSGGLLMEDPRRVVR